MLWHATEPLEILFWSKLSIVVFAKAVVAPTPGKVFAGVPASLDRTEDFRQTGHCVITN